MAEDIGVHQIERLVELLAPKECEDLLLALSHPEESIFQHLEQLSLERNRLNLPLRVKRDTVAAVGELVHTPVQHLSAVLQEKQPVLEGQQEKEGRLQVAASRARRQKGDRTFCVHQILRLNAKRPCQTGCCATDSRCTTTDFPVPCSTSAEQISPSVRLRDIHPPPEG